MKTIRFTASRADDYLHAQMIDLREAVNAGHEVIVLDLAGSISSPPIYILSLYDILLQRPWTTTLVTSANTPLLGYDILLWLAGDRRLIVPSAYIVLPHITPQQEEWGCAAGPIELVAYEDRREQESKLVHRDHERVMKRINEYLPVSEVAGKVLGPDDLRELHLIGGELDKILAAVGEENHGGEFKGIDR